MMNCFPSHSNQSGFTLTEASLAAALVAFALLPLVGLMGVISSGEKRVMDESASLRVVEMIGETLYRENRSIDQFVWHFPDSAQEPAVIQYPVGTAPTEVYFVGDETGLLVREVSEAEYQTGIPQAEIDETFVVKASMSQKATGTSSVQGLPDGVEILISVETPITLPAEKRTAYIKASRLL